MKKPLDEIDCTISDLKNIAAQRGHKPDWSKIEHDLRSYVAELNLARTPVFYGLKKAGKRQAYHRGMAATGRVAAARKSLHRIERAVVSAKELPDLLVRFAVDTYGAAGNLSLPRDDLEIYSRALVEIAKYFSLHRAAFDQLLVELGNTQGRKVPLVELRIGTPNVRFLRRLMMLWRDATGSDKQGEPFEGFAKRLMDTGLPHGPGGEMIETGDLSRQIKMAKKLNANPISESELITNIMNSERNRSRAKARGK